MLETTSAATTLYGALSTLAASLDAAIRTVCDIRSTAPAGSATEEAAREAERTLFAFDETLAELVGMAKEAEEGNSDA